MKIYWKSKRQDAKNFFYTFCYRSVNHASFWLFSRYSFDVGAVLRKHISCSNQSHRVNLISFRNSLIKVFMCAWFCKELCSDDDRHRTVDDAKRYRVMIVLLGSSNWIHFETVRKSILRDPTLRDNIFSILHLHFLRMTEIPYHDNLEDSRTTASLRFP
jgi:hypothetical protein